MGKALSIFGTILTVFVLYLFLLFTLQLVIVQNQTGTQVPTGRATVESGDEMDEARDFKFYLSAGNDLLELGENFGDVWSALGEDNLPVLLKGGEIHTQRGATTYYQYLRFEGSPAFSGLIVNFTENSHISDYMFADNGNNYSDALFEYQIEFEEGFESRIDSDDKLKDLNDRKINILGRSYVVTDTKIDTTNKELTIDFTDSAARATIEEGETKTFDIGGETYKVKVVIISEDSTPRVKLEVNGEPLNTLEEGELGVMSNGKFILIDDILGGEAGEGTKDMVDVYIEAYKLTFKDSEYTDSTFVKGFRINGKKIIDAFVSIRGNEISSSEFEITSINYRLISRDELYVGPGQGLRENLEQEEGMISAYWDIVYEGLDEVDVSILKFDPSGDDKYDVEFMNRRGKEYNFPLVSNRGGFFNLGDEDNNLTFIEAASSTTYNVKQNDFFVVTNSNDRKGYTNILRYNSIDTSSRTLTFDDLAGGTKQTTYLDSSDSGVLGTADLVVDGNTYRIFIADAAGNNLSIDLDGDSSVDGDEVNIIIAGGGILDLGSSNNPGNFTVTLTTESSQLDESSGDETISWQVESRVGNEVGISSFSGTPLTEEDNHEYGMTTYGTFVDFFDEAGEKAEELTIEYPEEQKGANVYITVKIPGKEDVSEVVVVEEEVVEEPEEEEVVVEEVKPKPAPVVRTISQVPVRTQQPQQKGSRIIPIAIVIVVILILIVIGVLIFSKIKPKEQSVFQSYVVR